MRTDSRIHLAAIALACVVGCGSSAPVALELRGAEMRARLPESVRELVPEGAILRLDERGEDGAYALQILTAPGGQWLPAPKKRPNGWEQHRMPATALEGLLATNLPALARGTPKEPRCVLTHWRDPDGAEIQIREIVTDQGWFASVERVVP